MSISGISGAGAPPCISKSKGKGGAQPPPPPPQIQQSQAPQSTGSATLGLDTKA